LSAEERAAALETTIAANEAKLEEQRRQTERLRSQGRITDQDRARASLEAKAEEIRAIFDPNEATVRSDVDSVVVELKALHFPPGEATLSPRQYPLMQKLRRAATMFEAKKVTVLAHTQGGDDFALDQHLAQERAEAVRDDLLTNEDLMPENVVAMTDESRGTDHRIDIRIEMEMEQ
jgi:outer membrane protein OmpA-like peptidoglycan-associated protein